MYHQMVEVWHLGLTIGVVRSKRHIYPSIGQPRLGDHNHDYHLIVADGKEWMQTLHHSRESKSYQQLGFVLLLFICGCQISQKKPSRERRLILKNSFLSKFTEMCFQSKW
jgi:hypothetical protein